MVRGDPWLERSLERREQDGDQELLRGAGKERDSPKHKFQPRQTLFPCKAHRLCRCNLDTLFLRFAFHGGMLRQEKGCLDHTGMDRQCCGYSSQPRPFSLLCSLVVSDLCYSPLEQSVTN